MDVAASRISSVSNQTSLVAPKNRSGRTQAMRRGAARAALLAAATDLLLEEGVRGVTLARVAERAGYGRGIVTHHFGSKHGLLSALVSEAQIGLAAKLVDEEPGLNRLLRLLELYVRSFSQSPISWRPFQLLWADAVGGSELQEYMRERDVWFRNHVRADVVAGISAGTIRTDVNPDLVAVRVVGELRGIGLQRALSQRSDDTAKLAAFVVSSWRRILLAN